jgi:hypothetical protein
VPRLFSCLSLEQLNALNRLLNSCLLFGVSLSPTILIFVFSNYNRVVIFNFVSSRYHQSRFLYYTICCSMNNYGKCMSVGNY